MFNNITLEKNVRLPQSILFVLPLIKYLLCLVCLLEIAVYFFILINSISLCTVTAFKENSENIF